MDSEQPLRRWRRSATLVEATLVDFSEPAKRAWCDDARHETCRDAGHGVAMKDIIWHCWSDKITAVCIREYSTRRASHLCLLLRLVFLSPLTPSSKCIVTDRTAHTYRNCYTLSSRQQNKAIFATTWLAEEDSTRKKKRDIVADEQCSYLKVSWWIS